MIRRAGMLAFIPLILILLIPPIASAQLLELTPEQLTSETAPDTIPGNFIAVNVRGTGTNESTDPMRMGFTTHLFSLATGHLIGTATDEIEGAPPVVVATTTFRLPQGEIVNRTTVSVVPDPQRPGFVLTGARPETDTIVSGTRAFHGRTGRVRLSGAVDVRNTPFELTFDDFFVIELNPQN